MSPAADAMTKRWPISAGDELGPADGGFPFAEDEVYGKLGQHEAASLHRRDTANSGITSYYREPGNVVVEIVDKFTEAPRRLRQGSGVSATSVPRRESADDQQGRDRYGDLGCARHHACGQSCRRDVGRLHRKTETDLQAPKPDLSDAMIWSRALIVKISIQLRGTSSVHRKLDHAMQDREPSTFESIWSGNVVAGQWREQRASLWNFLKSDRDEVLVVREPFGDQARAAVLVTAAVVASFGLGWAGGLNWPQFASELGLVEVAQKETPSPRISEARSSGRIEGARKTASASDSPAIVGSIPKPSALLPGGARPSAGPASQANAGPSAAVIAMRQPLVAAPETKPATIPGWTVVDVRDGTAVLEGPDGIRMAARGDTIPGSGRVESIVRWGNRWVIATASGLIATQ